MNVLGKLVEEGLEGWEVALWYYAQRPEKPGQATRHIGHFRDKLAAQVAAERKDPSGRDGTVTPVYVLTQKGSNQGFILSTDEVAHVQHDEAGILAEAIKKGLSKLTTTERLLLSVENIPQVKDRAGEQINQMDS